MRRCRHENADHLMPGDMMPSFPRRWEREFAENPFGLSSAAKARLDGVKPLLVIVEQFRCLDCGAWLSLGPANDDGPHAAQVAVELRAAELAVEFNGAMDEVGFDDVGEEFGRIIHACDGTDVRLLTSDGEWAGYLARAITKHEEE